MIYRFNTKALTKQQINEQLLVLDAKAGTSARATHYEGEDLVVTWPPSMHSLPPAKKGRGMFPKLQGAAAALGQLHHSLEDRADKFLGRVSAVETKGSAVFDKANAKLDAGEASLGEVDQILLDLEKATNGPPA